MSIVIGIILAIASVSWFLLRKLFKFSAKATRDVTESSKKYIEVKTKEYQTKTAPVTVENWYEKASIVCGETVDALLNHKTGTSERMVRSLAAKLGFAGATAGLFSIASIFGTAGTGTAISTLSGAAFNSAALKWISGGVSMAMGGWILFGVSLVAAVMSYFIAMLTFRKFTGKKRKLKDLDDQEKRVVQTLMLIAIGFRKQADQSRCLDPKSAAILHEKVFRLLSGELQKCTEKAAPWPTLPRERLIKQAENIKQLQAFLQRTAPPGTYSMRTVSGAERVDVVPVTVLKLLSTPIPSLNTEEQLVLEALRKTLKGKHKNASLGVLSEYLRLERIDSLQAKLEKVRRKYQQLSRRQGVASHPEEYTVAFVEAPDRPGVEVLIQNLRTREASMLEIHRADHEKLFAEPGAASNLHSGNSDKAYAENVFESSDSLSRDKGSEILENLSIAAMITLAKNAGAFLSGQPISKQRQKKLVEDGVVMVGAAGLSQLLM